MWDWRLYAEPANAANGRPFFDALNVRYLFRSQDGDQALAAKAPNLIHRRPRRLRKPDRVAARVLHRSARRLRPARARSSKSSGAPRGGLSRWRNEPTVMSASHSRRFPPTSRRGGQCGGDRLRLTENTTSFSVKATGPGRHRAHGGFLAGRFPRRDQRPKGADRAAEPCVQGRRGRTARRAARHDPLLAESIPAQFGAVWHGALLLAGSWVLALRSRKEKGA
jgi:hypothetical protein